MWKTFSRIIPVALILAGCQSLGVHEEMDDDHPWPKSFQEFQLYKDKSPGLMDFYKVKIHVHESLEEVAGYALGLKRSKEMLTNRLDKIRKDYKGFTYKFFDAFNDPNSPSISFVTNYKSLEGVDVQHRFDFILNDDGKVYIYSVFLDPRTSAKDRKLEDYYLWRII